MLVLFALLAAVSADNGHGVEDEKTEELVKSLRKQLIENNYDYMSKENGGDVINMRAQDDDVTQRSSTKHANNTVKEEVNLIFLKRQRVTSNRVTINTAHTTHRAHSADPDADVSKHDLLYYVDDRHFISKSGATTKKYKLLKLRHKSRRSGGGHLIQEEGGEGVAIVNLGGGPVPELRLPRSRRQYMRDHGEVDLDDDEPRDTVVRNPYISGQK